MDIQSSLQGLPFTVEGTGFAALLEQTENSGGCACTENKGYNCQEMKGGGEGGEERRKNIRSVEVESWGKKGLENRDQKYRSGSIVENKVEMLGRKNLKER